MLDTATLPSGLLTAEPAPFSVEAALFDRTLYVNFGIQDNLRLGAPIGDSVDGFYIRRVGQESVYELILVCNGPEWSELETGLYSNTLRCASRIAAIRLEAGMPFAPLLPTDASMCDPMLLGDGGLARSLSAAGVVLSILASGNGDNLGKALRSIH